MYDQDCKELILNPATIKTTMSPSPTTTSFSDRFSPPFKSENNALKNRCSTTTLHQTREYGNGSGFLYAPQQELYDNMLGSGLDCVKTIRHPDAGSFLHHSHLMAQNASSAPSTNNARLTNQMAHATLDTLDMMEAALSAGSVPSLTQMTDHHHHHPAFTSHGSHVGFHGTVYSSHAGSGSHPHTGLMVHPLPHHPGHHHLHPGIPIPIHDMDSDPRELEAFAERFKQRRIRLGVTQADVGRALANLRIPGVGSLSQSTICRFESLTLSHNNMIALKPILHAWLEEAEAQAREKPGDPENPSVLPSAEKKRKRTSIANPEKRSLEAFFAVQPRPSAEKIAAIAEKLDLKKNVVRVWFCNQRQKQKRLKFSTQHP